MKFTLFSAFLLSIGWMSVVVTGIDMPANCCLKLQNTIIQFEKIVKYDIQKATTKCSLRAVRFLTKQNKVLCSNPDSDWTQKAMRIVDGRMTKKPSKEPTMCYTSTTNTIPTVTTTNKTPGTETETSTSTTAPLIVTRIKTSRPKTEITKTTNQPTAMSKENPKSSFSTATNKTPGPETETSTSTTAPPIVTRIKTSRPKTEITKTTNQPIAVSKENPKSSFSTATKCGTGGPTSPTKETTHERPGIDTTTATTSTSTTTKTKLSKLLIKKRGKSKSSLRKFQMRIHQNKLNNHTHSQQ